MYRLLSSTLGFAVLVAAILSAAGVLPYDWLAIIFAGMYLPLVAVLGNRLGGRLVAGPTNDESAVITALIITLIVGPWPPLVTLTQGSALVLLAIASKFLLAVNRRHLFNPAAAGVLIGSWWLGVGASWWVGNVYLAPLILVGGIWLVGRARRWPIVAVFLVTGALVWPAAVWPHLLATPLIFFTLVMLIEPQTSPGAGRWRLVYGALVAGLIAVFYRWWPQLPYALELSLLIGNLFYWLVARDRQVTLGLKKQLTHNRRAATFVFTPSTRLNFSPGQYLEWTLPHPHPDSRGIRRWFTISSSPTEADISLTTVFTNPGSSFKRALRRLKPGDTLTVAGLAGDFTLPAATDRPLLFIAGGVGITPFHSMITYLITQRQRRDIILIYANRTADDILFTRLWATATKEIGLKVIHTLTDSAPAGWSGERGYLDAALLKRVAPDWRARQCYLSGPEPMVKAYATLLTKLGLPSRQLKRDYFPGY